MRLSGDRLIRDNAPRGTRAKVRVLVKVTGTAYPPDPCVTSLQLIDDDTGNTTAVGHAYVYY
jgi:hypothetical protein